MLVDIALVGSRGPTGSRCVKIEIATCTFVQPGGTLFRKAGAFFLVFGLRRLPTRMPVCTEWILFPARCEDGSEADLAGLDRDC